MDEIILPGEYTNAVDERWLSCQRHFAEQGLSDRGTRPIYSTLALGADAVRNAAQMDSVVDETVNSGVDGVYVLLRSPGDAFLVDDESYLYALWDALLSLADSDKEVIVGYASQQALVLASVGVETIASGNFRNVRSFNPEIFDVQEESERQRATWYYDADTLSELRIQTLELAFRRNLRHLFGPACGYCNSLLSAQHPVAVGWGEPEAFRHWLFELNRQWLGFDIVSRTERVERVLNLLTATQARLQQMFDHQVLPGERSFQHIFDPCFAALQALRADRESSFRGL